MEIAIYNPAQVSEIQKTNRIPEELLPKTREKSLEVLAIWPKQYFKTLSPARCEDIFSSILPSIALCKKELGVTKVRAILVVILIDLANQYNTGQNMDEFQIADLADDIIEMYYWLKIDDLKLCFKYAKVGRFGVVYRIDGPTILGWLDAYSTHRLRSAEEFSYTEHASTKNETRVENVEQVYKEFEKRRFQER